MKIPGYHVLALFTGLAYAVGCSLSRGVLVECESFADPGGWVVNTQFIDIMGSPYLLAHGLGTPVRDAVTTVTLPEAGTYRVHVRTKDWVARWNAPGAPGHFKVLINDRPQDAVFGAEGAEWHWQDGGAVELPAGPARVALHDLTGFEGRCDAIWFSREAQRPPDAAAALAAWRRRQLGLPDRPPDEGPFDLVVVGGGYAGITSAVSAARMGCRVALIQDRPVLGGNGSSEIRVWAQGNIKLGPFPRLGEIVEEFMDNAPQSPGEAADFGDAKKEAVVRAEPDIALFLEHYVRGVETRDGRIVAVTAFDVRSGRERRFPGSYFVDCTGHGTIGFRAGADHTVRDTAHMGMSNMWRWADAGSPQPFPEVPWALDLETGDFPYPTDGRGPWYWETGFNRDPILDLEYMRDWNFRAVYGAFNAMKNRRGRDKHVNARLEWIAHVGGTRESRQLLGDVVLAREDIVEKRSFPDACVTATWDIDLHHPEDRYRKKYPDEPFISRAEFPKAVDRNVGYPFPYRCLYSRNIPNLFMAGRCISVTHEALGSIRVQKTTGMMGEVVGKAASICVARGCAPREVYASHLEELKELMRLPGETRRMRGEPPRRQDAKTHED